MDKNIKALLITCESNVHLDVVCMYVCRVCSHLNNKKNCLSSKFQHIIIRGLPNARKHSIVL